MKILVGSIEMKTKIKDLLLLLSPIAIILLLRWAAMLLSGNPSNWVWVPFVLLYWLVMAVIMKVAPLSLTGIFSKSSVPWYWALIAIVMGMGGISYLFENWEYYTVPQYVLAGLVFSLVNPVMEETYWRKLFIDRYPQQRYLVVLCVSAAFALMHYFSLGIISSPNREPIILPITFVAGLLWSVVYIRTKTLRYVILSHLLMDVFGFSALFIR